jgi:hypothetical protein
MIKVYSDVTQTTLQRTLYLPPVDQPGETLVAWKKKDVRQELVDGAERMRVIGYTPVMNLKWKIYNDLSNYGITRGQADGQMLTLTDLQEVLALAPGRLRVSPGPAAPAGSRKGFQALVTKEPDYKPVLSGLGGDVNVEFTGRAVLTQPILPDF